MCCGTRIFRRHWSMLGCPMIPRENRWKNTVGGLWKLPDPGKLGTADDIGAARLIPENSVPHRAAVPTIPIVGTAECETMNMDDRRPEHCPRGHEWLPDAFNRDIAPYGDPATEAARRQLAEGDIEATLRQSTGDRHPVDRRMWEKEPLRSKVYPRFSDGWMRMRLTPYTGPYVKGWVFVPLRCFADISNQRRTVAASPSRQPGASSIQPPLAASTAR